MPSATILLNSLAIMLAIVVPTILATLRSPGGSAPPTRGPAICPTGPIRGGRAHRLVDSGAGGLLPRRHCLARLARARSGPPAATRAPSRSRSMSSRSTGNGCSSIRSRASPASTGWSCRSGCRCTCSITSATRVERVLRAAAGQRDLRDVRHGDPAQPAGRPARVSIPACPRTSAATASPT